MNHWKLGMYYLDIVGVPSVVANFNSWHGWSWDSNSLAVASLMDVPALPESNIMSNSYLPTKPLNLIVFLLFCGWFGIGFSWTTITYSSDCSFLVSLSSESELPDWIISISYWSMWIGTCSEHLWFFLVHFAPHVKHKPFAFMWANNAAILSFIGALLVFLTGVLALSEAVKPLLPDLLRSLFSCLWLLCLRRDSTSSSCNNAKALSSIDIFRLI